MVSSNTIKVKGTLASFFQKRTYHFYVWSSADWRWRIITDAEADINTFIEKIKTIPDIKISKNFYAKTEKHPCDITDYVYIEIKCPPKHKDDIDSALKSSNVVFEKKNPLHRILR